ncbi:MAG: SWIM zinc finger family protein, partial [Sedimenticolaceae bacterium]
MDFTPTKTDIRTACGDRAYARGLEYARSNRVLDLDPQEVEAGLQVTASVRGNEVYEQLIDVSEFMGTLEIEGECTCPVGYNCKHVAAVLITLLDEAHPQPLERQR